MIGVAVEERRFSAASNQTGNIAGFSPDGPPSLKAVLS